jgi:ATP-dependent protease ClpP protease subunit
MDFYIIFEGVIDQSASQRLVDSIKKAEQAGASKIFIFFSSLGGNIYEGFLIATIIQNSKIPISIHSTNHIDSIANIIYLSAPERTSESYAKFYMHGASTSGNFDEKGLNDQLTATKTHNTRIAYFISENSNLPLQKIQHMMNIGTTITAQKALEYGIVQTIIHKEIPKHLNREEIIYIN